MFRTVISLIGLLYLYPKIKSLALFFFNLIFGPKRDLLSIYGSGSYVLVTGGSEGIGQALAEQFAARGFNLVLVSRSMDKLNAAKAQIQFKYPKCKVLVASFDFDKVDDPKNFELGQAFGLDFSQIDVSVVVNNVGIGRSGLFYDSSEEHIKKMIRVNCVSQVLVTRYFIGQFLKRKSRSAVISVSSISALKALPLYDVYGATKRFNLHFSESIGNFYSKIDMYSFVPGHVSTRLTNFRKIGSSTVAPDECAEAAINQFGSYRYLFYGHWRHEIFGFFVNLVPEWVQGKIIMLNKEKFMKKIEE